MFRSTVRGAAAAALTVTLAALTVSCGNDAEPKAKASPPAAAASPATSAPVPGAASPSAGSTGTGTPAPAAKPTAQASANGPSALPSAPPELVRDAFAGLQATLNDSCTPGNCAYFLGRVYDELHRLDRAMKADAKGPGHFPEPIALIVKLDNELGGDRTFENLKKHQGALIGTRDQINTWMQDHPDDYR
ncbi:MULTISPECIES: hypothetical protein [Streptomyces]|uniref:hypothetical protein n=1 Tax=Streptomyces TaxID=1883 RepID=UPI000F79CBB8|nr:MULTISPECIES: hypothetical protein [Streptomyces]RST05847.1 hypothetical protein EF910_11855 [Streptomyces sp. WAC07149]GLX21278.1 hypothetical protein Slala01_49220 [Streptomyces lavendulae subsp. lavendulae]GLX27797.1 hypothetical protein Slala02_36170 [Streptomyces lavendulae subsp. lavendulae]